MAFYYDKNGAIQQAPKLDEKIYRAAHDENKTVAAYINGLYPDGNTKDATVFQQLCASEGLIVGKNDIFGLRAPSIADILDGKSGFQAASPTNTEGKGTPWGSQSRILFPAAVIQLIEDAVQPDRHSDEVMFQEMIAMSQGIDGDTYLQPVLSYANTGGANAGTNAAKAQRVSQLGDVPTMLTLTTSDRARNIPTYGVGIEMSDQAMRATTLDLLALTIGRFLLIEKDQRVYTYLSNLFAGDLDQNTGAVSAVTTVALDPACAAGTVTHKSWIQFLARNRKKRKITHCVSDIATYLKVEGRTGRPGTNAYDPTIARIDPQARAMNVPFGSDVRWFLVDAAVAGGPVPADTVWALDSRQAVMMVSNTQAAYQATEQFVLRRSSNLVIHWAEEVCRLYAADLTPFDVLTVA